MNRPLGEIFEQRQIDVGLAQIDEIEADFFADGSQGVLLGDVAQSNGDLIEARIFPLRIASALQLLLVEQAAFEENVASFHNVTGVIGRSFGRR